MEPARSPSSRQVSRISGLGVSPGIAIGVAHVLVAGLGDVPHRTLLPEDVAGEVDRFRAACIKAGGELSTIAGRLAGIGEGPAGDLAGIIEVQVSLLKGSRLTRTAEARIERERVNAEWAIESTVREFVTAFAEIEDSYLAQRIDDVRAAADRVMRHLARREEAALPAEAPTNAILIADDFTPAEAAVMDPLRVAGFAAAQGGAQGHTAIMARALGIPAVLGAGGITEHVRTGDTVIVDGDRGLLIVNPDATELTRYRQVREEGRRRRELLQRLASLPAVTTDGENVHLHANIELPIEVESALESGAEGVGLLRSEFLFLNRYDLPDEDEQAEVFGEIVAGMDGRLVTIRTLDIGGDKASPALAAYLPPCPNPALGLRAVRMSLNAPALLSTQLRAILRAGARGPVRILLPMITTPREVARVRQILNAEMAALRQSGAACVATTPPLGAMIEVPAAALAADALAKACDFFSIGTNDLTMYALAIDRANEQVANLYDPLNPAVLRLIQFTTAAALRAGIPVNICGEMAGDPRYTSLLVGLGLRDLSMTARALLAVKSRVRAISAREATRRAEQIMAQSDAGRIAALLDDFNALA